MIEVKEGLESGILVKRKGADGVESTVKFLKLSKEVVVPNKGPSNQL